MKSRLTWVFGLGLLWIVVIVLRLYQLQVVRHDHYTVKAGRQQQRVLELDSPRGTIYDARGRALAVSVPVDSAYAVPSRIKDPKKTAAAIARVVPGIDVRRLTRQLSGDREFEWVARKLDAPVAQALRSLELPGIEFAPESKRYYPMRELAAQVLGYVGTDNQGLAGLEQFFNREITGKRVTRTVLRDAKAGTVVSPDLSTAEAQPGKDLHLTIDAAIQHIVYRELARAVDERGAKSGSAVFLDPATGAVLAMVSYPSFDPNHFGDFPKALWRNRTVSDVIEPGSTFKIVTAAAALESGLVHPADLFDCQMGSIVVAGKRIRDHKPFGELSFSQVLAKSSNVGVIKAALKIGDERLFSTISGFGFGHRTGIDLPGESVGILHPLEKWNHRSKAYISFGQGISVTPIQLVSAVGAVANDGRLLRPYVVSRVGTKDGADPRRQGPIVVGQPIRPETARVLKEMLEGVVAGGTGRTAGVLGYRVAGKTGTAQIPVAGGYAHSSYLPSFVGFAPVERPVIVGLVTVDEPRGAAYHGGQVAAPVFGAIARQILLYMGIRPRREQIAFWPGQVTTAEQRAAATATKPAFAALEDDGAALEDRIAVEDVEEEEHAAPAVAPSTTAAASAPVAVPAPAPGRIEIRRYPAPGASAVPAVPATTTTGGRNRAAG